MALKSAQGTLVADREVSFQITRLLAMLRQFAGFRPSQPVQRKLEKIFGQMPAADFARWIKQVEADPQRTDLIALVEDLTNHETYFFREKVHLDALSKSILPELIMEKSRHAGPKRVVLWSAACSSGEEVYTLAMLALEVMTALGFAREVRPGEYLLAADWSLEIIGTDISRQAIRLAKEGVYGARADGLSSFRKFPEEYLRFFLDADATSNVASPNRLPDRKYYRIKSALARYTRFQIFNLVNSSPLLFDVDVVFCRNVLIYIEPDIQKNIVSMLAKCLRPDGFLILGLVDTPEMPPIFSKSVLSQCVVYRKVNHAS